MSSNTAPEYGNAIAIDLEKNQPDPQTVRMFSIMFEHSNDLFFIVPPSGSQFTFISKAAQKILGYPVDELLNKPAKAVVSPASLTNLCDALHRAAASGIANDGLINLDPQPIEIFKKDATILQATIYCSLQMSTDHTVITISGVVVPIPSVAATPPENAKADSSRVQNDPVVASVLTDKPGAITANEQGRLLIMDDEEILIDIALQMGKRMGLKVDSSKNGDQAIEKYQKAFDHGQPYDAVLLDMTIAGGMGGLETSKRLHAINPDVKAIVISGYSDHEVMANPTKYGFVGVISKPFRLTEFGRILREIIPVEKFRIG